VSLNSIEWRHCRPTSSLEFGFKRSNLEEAACWLHLWESNWIEVVVSVPDLPTSIMPYDDTYLSYKPMLTFNPSIMLRKWGWEISILGDRYPSLRLKLAKWGKNNKRKTYVDYVMVNGGRWALMFDVCGEKGHLFIFPFHLHHEPTLSTIFQIAESLCTNFTLFLSRTDV
jgi:hypothetical protein